MKIYISIRFHPDMVWHGVKVAMGEEEEKEEEAGGDAVMLLRLCGGGGGFCMALMSVGLGDILV